MYKKNIFIVVLVLGLLIVVLLYTKKSKNNSQEPIVGIPTDTTPTPINSVNKKLSPIQKVNTLPLPIEEKQMPKTLELKSAQSDIYEILSIEEASLTTQPRDNIVPVGAIRMPNNSMATLTYKDTFVLKDIEGIDYTMTISNIEEHNDGSVTKTGQFTDEGITYTTTITQVKNTSFITLSTPQGLYEIETNNEVGYIYRTDTMRKQMQNTKINDVIVLPIPKAPAD